MSFRSICALLLLTLLACQEEVETPEGLAEFRSYYPVELNRAMYYRVDSVVLVPTVSGIRYDSSRTEARETLVEEFTGADGQTVYRGERWERPDEQSPWTFKQTYTITPSPAALRRSEDNLTFLKLVRPVREGISWDGHAAFDESRDLAVGGEFLDVYNGWDYRYAAVDGSLTLPGGEQLDSVVTVRQAEQDILIDYRQAYERYAAGWGLVERFLDARHTQCQVCCGGNTGNCASLSWDEKAEKGHIIRETLLRRD